MKQEPADIGPSDVDLVQRAQSGDADAFGELVTRYQDRVYNTCLRLCRNEATALDLTQGTFLKALEALPRFEARAQFFTWLFRIAVNQAFSELRRKKRQPVISLDNPRGGDTGPEPTVAARVDTAAELDLSETHARISVALERLEPEFRAAVVLKDVEDMDYAAIAEILEVPIGTVKSRIYRGRMMLRELLRGEEDDGGNAPA